MNKLTPLKSLPAILVLLSIGLLFSCKKNTDTDPVVTYTSPYVGQIFNAGDNVNVVAHVAANQNLQFVKLSLLNSNYVAVNNITSFSVSGSSLDINQNITLDNSLATGTYYITINAYDGTRMTNAYQQIYVHGIPLVRKAIYVVTGSNFQNTKVYKIDTNNVATNIISLNGDFASSAISSKDQCLYTTGIFSGDFNNIDLNAETINWSINNPGTGLPFYENVYYANGLTYLSLFSQTIKGYDKSKNVNFTANTSTNTYPHIVFNNGSYVFAEQRNISSYDVRLKVYYAQSGAGFQEFVINQDVAGMYSYDANDIILFMNNNGNGSVLIYNINNNTTTQPIVLPAGKIYSVLQITPTYYLLAYQNQVYYYSTANVGHTGTYQSIPASQAMQFDSLNNEVFIANATHLDIYDYTSSSLINTITLPDSIKDIRILYNK